MKFTGNYTIENGKFEATYSAEIAICGLVVKVKELELQGDVNDLMDSFSSLAEKKMEDREVDIAVSLASILGIKPEVVARFVYAVKNLK